MIDTLFIIPVRWASTRFPGKPLALLRGVTVLERVYQQCTKAVSPSQIVVATDDRRIAEHARTFGAQVEMTSSTCATGTDRVAEVARRRSASWYVNIQGDEPFVDPAAIRAIINAALSEIDEFEVFNGMTRIDSESEYRSPMVPKVVCGSNERLLYISRAPIPANKSAAFFGAFRQVGVYAFTREALMRFSSERAKSALEAVEDIEILRCLENNMPVKMVEVPQNGIAIDTPRDLQRAEKDFLLFDTAGTEEQ